ncbi:tail fiber domain-containing protein [Pedobacter sp.]|uniref:tail fiber domain-containing protein n=1 Tax=Pedobacter sp. TaxID=1411316 RepID=UPI0031DD8DF0
MAIYPKPPHANVVAVNQFLKVSENIMSNIPPIEDGYIDNVIKSSGPLKPNLNKTQGIELRALVKLLRDRLEGEISDHYASNQAALSGKANIDQVVLKTTKVNGKPLYGDITLDKSDVGLSNVNNTSDLDKPLSSFAQAALALKADMVDVNDKLSLKVDKVSGKQLSTEDFSSAEKDKLAGIQNGATSNESNAYLLAREHHTGSQAIETVFGLRSQLDEKVNQSEKGQANGIATLDVNGKIPVGQLSEAILGSVNYQGNYDASNNSPSLPAASGNKGKYYVVAVPGNQQGLELNIGDWIISNGNVWERVDNNNKVTSVNGRQGSVMLGKVDIGLGSVDNTTDAAKPVSVAQQAALDGKANSNGSNAAGVWGIDISGNANTVSSLNTSQIFTAINGSNLGSNTLNVNIFGRSGYSDRVGNGSADMAFHWQGQSGQPNWLWGGNDARDMYVYNPANFNVAHAINADNAANWNRIIVNDFDFPVGFQLLEAGGETTDNQPIGGQWGQGIQFSTNNNPAYGNQLVFTVNGNLWTRTKQGSGYSGWDRIITASQLGSAAYLNASVSSVGDNLVRRDSSGDVFANALHVFAITESNNQTNYGSLGYMYGGNGDNYIRRYTFDHVKQQLGISNLGSLYQPLENQRLSNTNAVQFQSVFLNEYVSTPKIDLRGVTNPSFIQGNGEFIDIRPSSDVRFLSITNNDAPTVVIHARDGQVDMALLMSSAIQNAGRIQTGTLSLNATPQDVADIDKVLVGKLGTGDAYWASNNYFKNNILGLGSAAYLNANSAHTAANQVVTRDGNATMGAQDVFIGVRNAYISALLDVKANSQYLAGTRDMNEYLPVGLYEIESGGGTLSNTPVGNTQSNNFSYMSIGSPSRNFQMMTQYGTTDVYVRSRSTNDGLNFNFSAWERLVKSSELGSAAHLNADTSPSNQTVVKRNEAGHVFSTFFNASDNTIESFVPSALYAYNGSDGYLRKVNANGIRTFLGLGSAAYLNGSGGDDAIQFGHVVKYNSSGFIRTAAKNHPQSGGLTALYGGKSEDDFVWAFNNDAVKAFLNYNGSQIYSDVSNVNADIQVSKYLRWKQHGNGHVIFDASAGTSPSGASIDRNNPQVQADGGVNPVLMGWNGVNTYGVRVDNARLADHALNTDKWAGLSRTAGIVNSGEISYLHILNGSGDNSGFADRNTIKSWLGINTDNQWSTAAGDIDLNLLSDFIVQESYGASINTPFGQHYNLIVNFKTPSGGQRGLQLASHYGSVDHFYLRSKFDATGQWKAWKEVATHDQLSLQLITNGGTLTSQAIGVNMYDGQPAPTISLAIGDSDTGFQRGGDGVTGYYSNSNFLYNLNDPASIKNFLNLNTNQDPTFRNISANEGHFNKIWSFYGEASVNNYSWTDAALTTTSIEIVTSGNNAYTDRAPTLVFHRYGSGGPQFRLDPTGTNVLYLESANANSSRNGTAYGGGNNNYFNKLFIDGGLKVNSTLELPGISMNAFLAGNGDNATYDVHNFKLKGWWGLGMQAYDDVVRGVYDFRRGLWDTDGGYKVHSNIHIHSPRFGFLGGSGSQLNYAQGQIVLGGHFINGAYELPTDSVNNGGALITSDIFGTVRVTTIGSTGNSTTRNISPTAVNEVSKVFTFGTDGGFTSDYLSTGNIYLNRGQETPGSIDKFAVGQTGDTVIRWTPVSSIVNILGLQNGGYNDATRLQSTTHAGTFWLENHWDGTYWQLHSNHGSPVNVGRANIADASNYVNSLDGSRQPNDILPQNNPNRVRFDFSHAANVGVGGNYAGVMTYSPWSGTTASTGDASYQLIFGSTGPNAEGVPMLRIRKGIDTGWNAFYDIYTSADISKVRNDLGLGASAYEATTLQQAYNRGNSIIGSLNIASGSPTDLGFNSAGLVIREGNMGGGAQAKPRLSFHWAGVVASQLSLDSDGTIAVINNPGTGYEKLKASSVGVYELRSINARNDGGIAKIDFADIGIGYGLSAKYWTFWNGPGEHYGMTNDYSGTGAQLSIIAAQAGGNIRFYSGMDTGTNRAIERMSIESNGDVYVKGYTYFHGDIKIGHNQGASRITMGDADEQQRDIHCNSNRIGFLNAGGGWGAYCNNDGGWISDNYIGGGRIFAGFDSGMAGSVNASNWFRSNGATGWYNETFGGGIFMSDPTWVRVHGSKAFWADNGARFLDNITIDKSGSYGTLTFGTSPNGNDPAFIRHFETPNGGNNGRMEFSVSDDIGDNDYFSFGSTSGSGGSYQETIRFTTGGNAKFNGYVTAVGGGGTSDIRHKKVVENQLDLSWLDTDRTIAFKWKDDKIDQKTHFGYSAQEIQEWCPDLIFSDAPEKLALNQIELLTLENKRLKERVSILEAMIK